VLAASVHMREGSERELAQRTGPQRRVLARALKRPVELDYALSVTTGDQAIFQAPHCLWRE
jgi:hypothetical protein